LSSVPTRQSKLPSLLHKALNGLVERPHIYSQHCYATALRLPQLEFSHNRARLSRLAPVAALWAEQSNGRQEEPI
jgi:hypothetical protein